VLPRDRLAHDGLILAVNGGTIAEVSRALRELLIRHVDVGTIPGGVALMGAGDVEVVTAGGLGTNFFVDPDGTAGILLTQVEMGKDTASLIAEFQSLHKPS
jgi:hypothetical protein